MFWAAAIPEPYGCNAEPEALALMIDLDLTTAATSACLSPPIIALPNQAQAELQPLSNQAQAELQPLPNQAQAELQPLPNQAQAELRPLPNQAQAELQQLPNQAQAELQPLPNQAQAELRPLPNQAQAEGAPAAAGSHGTQTAAAPGPILEGLKKRVAIQCAIYPVYMSANARFTSNLRHRLGIPHESKLTLIRM